MSRLFIGMMAGWLALLISNTTLIAGTIAVPNASFESPTVTYVSVNIDYWQKTAQPTNFDDSSGFEWTYETGLFLNTPTNSSDHIDNCDAKQAIWLFAVPQVGLFQDNNTTDANHTNALHLFDVKYEVGKSYQLTVGVIGGGGGMSNGVTLDLSLYFRDANSNMITVADTSITNTPDVFPVTTHLVDFSVNVPTVRATDLWAGQNIGIQMLSTTSPTVASGYWDLDNVRLSSILAPTLLGSGWTNGQFQFNLQGEPGSRIKILSSTNVTSPVNQWEILTTLTNTTGSIPFVDTNAATSQRFYQAVQSP